MIYKMPIVKDGSVPGVEQGLGFYYMDARSAGKWTASKKLLNETGHAISNTLKWFYDRQTDPWVFHVMYNDAVKIWELKISIFEIFSHIQVLTMVMKQVNRRNSGIPRVC